MDAARNLVLIAAKRQRGKPASRTLGGMPVARHGNMAMPRVLGMPARDENRVVPRKPSTRSLTRSEQ
jgi:hypothetical protein